MGSVPEVSMRSNDCTKTLNGFRKNGSAALKSLEGHLKRYAENLLGSIAVTEDSLSFFFSVIEPYELKDLYDGEYYRAPE
jgi:hypothetical protein